MLELADDWAWDFWVADDGDDFHLFFLVAPRSLGDPQLRHLNARVGHAVSPDLRTWTRLANALEPDQQHVDDTATWTGSIVRDGDGGWQLFYTGMSRRGEGYAQTICRATSTDLVSWRKDDHNPILVPDARWYDIRPDPDTTDWRDPWVFADPSDAGWHMLFTAAANHSGGAGAGAGVVGHATSPDLVTWQAAPPLSRPGAGLAWLEVTQVAVVEGRPVVIFSCLSDKLTGPRLDPVQTGGVWAAPAEAVTGPFDVANAYPLTDDRLYSGRLVQERNGRWALMAFHNIDSAGEFVGTISDPMPVRWDGAGRLAVELPGEL